MQHHHIIGIHVKNLNLHQPFASKRMKGRALSQHPVIMATQSIGLPLSELSGARHSPPRVLFPLSHPPPWLMGVPLHRLNEKQISPGHVLYHFFMSLKSVFLFLCSPPAIHRPFLIEPVIGMTQAWWAKPQQQAELITTASLRTRCFCHCAAMCVSMDV